MIPAFVTTIIMPTTAITTATLDPGTEFQTTLSNGNLTAAGASTSGKVSYAISTTNHSSGKFYYEVTVVSNPTPSSYSIGCGIANTSGAPTSAGNSGSGLGNNLLTGGIWANSSDGHFYQHNNIGTASGITYGTNGDIVGVALDIGNNAIWYRVNGGNWNGSSSNNPVTNVGGISVSNTNTGSALWALVEVGVNPNNGTMTINFGGSAYNNAAPSGFGNW